MIEEKVRNMIQIAGRREDFQYQILVAHAQRLKTDSWDIIKLQSFFIS